MKTQSSTTLKLAIVFAMVVTMTLSAAAQSYNPNQVAVKRWYAANNAIDFAGAPYNFNAPHGPCF